MSKYESIEKLNIDGYLFTSDIVNAGISKTWLARYVKEMGYERVAQGVYVSPETWPDELFILNRAYPNIIFSGETALYLHLLVDREYSEITVSVPSNFSGQRLRDKGVIVHREREAIYGLGKTQIETNYGHLVNVYDMERSICDMVKNRQIYDVQTYQTALKEFFRKGNVDYSKLLEYADRLNIKQDIKKYLEVMI
ncbi:MAG: abortive phage infection protein [Lachnospiraceae bacterium]|nr:abortive phage infection protein [Lachnospiraceae bacterium]